MIQSFGSNLTNEQVKIMQIRDLTNGMNITIVANISGEQLQFDSVVEEVHPKKRLVLCSPVFHNGKVISFQAKGLVIDILAAPEEDKPILFKNASITVMKKKDGSFCYNLDCQTEGKAFNRRKYFRCYVGVHSSVRFGPNRSTHSIVIKDVSAEGFAFVCDNDVTFQKEQVVHSVLNDYMAELAENFSFHLYGIIVRSYPLDETRTVYGCRLNTKVPGLEHYIMKKERLRLKKRHGSMGLH